MDATGKTEKPQFTGSDTEGGITSSYAIDDGVKLKVPYSFMGSVYGPEEEQAALEAMRQDTLTMGPQVKRFQEVFAAHHQVRHAFAVSNCTTGMHLCTQLMDIRAGDEVIVTPNTFIATSLVVLKEKAIPVYADIDPRTYNISPEAIARKITPRTRAIYVVHYGGLMCDMDPIMALARKHNLYVLEDCAHAPDAEYKGRKAGSIGDVGVFSFHSLKNITTCGEGGMITTNRDEWAAPIEALRCMNLDHYRPGQTRWEYSGGIVMEKRTPLDYWIPSHFDVKDVNGHWGNNYRMNEIQAAVGRVQVGRLPALTARRRAIGQAITAGLQGIRGVTPVFEPEGYRHVYHLYTLCVEPDELGASRDDFLRILYKEEGIQAILHYQPTYHFSGVKNLAAPGNCPRAEAFFYHREMNLPMHPRLTDGDVAAIVEGVRNAARKAREGHRIAG